MFYELMINADFLFHNLPVSDVFFYGGCFGRRAEL